MPQEFGDDLKLMFKNRYRYNQPEHDVFVKSKKLETVFDTSISGSSSRSSNFVENSEEKRHNNKLNTLEERYYTKKLSNCQRKYRCVIQTPIR